jgi:hypothetical protein
VRGGHRSGSLDAHHLETQWPDDCRISCHNVSSAFIMSLFISLRDGVRDAAVGNLVYSRRGQLVRSRIRKLQGKVDAGMNLAAGTAVARHREPRLSLSFPSTFYYYLPVFHLFTNLLPLQKLKMDLFLSFSFSLSLCPFSFSFSFFSFQRFHHRFPFFFCACVCVSFIKLRHQRERKFLSDRLNQSGRALIECK